MMGFRSLACFGALATILFYFYPWEEDKTQTNALLITGCTTFIAACFWRFESVDAIDALPGRKGFFYSLANIWAVYNDRFFQSVRSMTSDGNRTHLFQIFGQRLIIFGDDCSLKHFHQHVRGATSDVKQPLKGGAPFDNIFTHLGGAPIFMQEYETFSQIRAKLFHYLKSDSPHLRIKDYYDALTPILHRHLDQPTPVDVERMLRDFNLNVFNLLVAKDVNLYDAEKVAEAIEHLLNVIHNKAEFCSEATLMKEKNFAESKKFLCEIRDLLYAAGQKSNGGMAWELQKEGWTTRDGKFKFNEETIKDLIALLEAAAYDTTYSMLKFLIYMIATHPNECAKIREDLFQRTGGRFDNLEAMQESELIESFYWEVLRLFPPAYFQMRLVSTDTFTVPIPGDKFVTMKKGDIAIMDNYGAHRAAEKFPLPEEFKAFRFVNDLRSRKKLEPLSEFADCAAQTKFIYSFSNGKNQCPGRNLVLLEARMVMIYFLIHYNITTEDKPSVTAGFTLRFNSPYSIMATPCKI